MVIRIILALIMGLIVCAIASGQVRNNRTASNPQSIIPGATMRPNLQGGVDYWVKGRKVGYSRRNVHNSYDIYIKGRLKYRGLHFNNTGTTRFNVEPSQSSTRKSEQEKLKEYLKRWNNSRTSYPGGVYWWEHYYPSIFRND